ncbi:MAG: DNA-processing protein DprA [Candidatus Pacebacteria bacterium]|jgi:DNA processing protein|nr:DNA-protecting protein DprA [Parcubacteria group bacterium]MDP7159067.1 DNA-processing protein DprA [Candidatus Paceibacterota bacterium]MDP7466117.1 DNA-processing protein DprA [Candidatus Paceibacterota bacterium]MDP7648185.1 DNA-processing protein DprA [Candidatus Paceibacterota bacterium]HJO89637.1 DNA-processing protein DprA [Candidatus Paceibacterota bacterium]|tara:strand:+ start:34753 stop:35601 length:849 start_codon:yes stop_codon:yes gene_type:complete
MDILTKEQFPQLLQEINDPPKKLHVKGKLPEDDMKFLCVVGSRKYSPYGKEACKTLIEGLRGYDVVIVSGLALGIDGIAHEAALDAGLTTIAVPGSGLGDDVLYPSTHKNLAKRILDAGGALISEFEENFRATSYSFPQRNRIMAGMSHATLIIEAEEKSGTLITSKFATEYNRDVLTVPASIFSDNSYGPHMLLRLGATPVTSSEDILEAFGLKADVGQQKLKLEDLSSDEKKVVEILKNPVSRDELVARLGLPIQKANVTLSAMEIKGIIKESMGEMRIK